MDQHNIDMFMAANQKYLPSDKLTQVIEKLQTLEDEDYYYITNMGFQNPKTVLLVSVFLGILGVDRFMLEHIGMGLLKLFTFGGFGILLVADWLTIYKKTKKVNLQKILELE